MDRIKDRDIIQRFKKTPIIELEHLSFTCLNIMNAGAAKMEDQYILLVRIETMKGHSVFVAARSVNGTNFALDKKPIMVPATEGEFQAFEEHGVADPRITYMDGVFYIMYTAISRHGGRDRDRDKTLLFVARNMAKVRLWCRECAQIAEGKGP